MSLQIIALLFGIIILRFFSGFFSASETALMSLSRTDVKRMSGGNQTERLVFKLLRQPQRLLSTILVGNMFVNVLMAALFSAFLSLSMSPSGSGVLESMLSRLVPKMSEGMVQHTGQLLRSL